jgi:hypothetical protein
MDASQVDAAGQDQTTRDVTGQLASSELPRREDDLGYLQI